MILKFLRINQIMSLKILLVFLLATSSILGESLLEEASGNSTTAWGEATNENTDWGKRRHIYAKGTVRTASSIFFSEKLVLKLPENAGTVGDIAINSTHLRNNPNRGDISRELGTIDILEKYKIYKNLAFYDQSSKLKPGSILMLNTPDELFNPNTFFNEFNKDFLDFIIENKNKIEIVFTTNPVHPNLFKAWDSNVNDFKKNFETGLFEPSGFAKEIRYLRNKGINKVKFKDGSILVLSSVDLDNIGLDWETNWIYD